MITKRIVVAAAAVALTGTGMSQGLIGGNAQADARYFSGEESRTWISARYSQRLGEKFTLRLSGSSAAKKYTNIAGGVLRTGGTDLEAGVETSYDLLPIAQGLAGKLHGYMGVALADMASFDGTALAYSLEYQFSAPLGVADIRAGIRGVSGDDLRLAALTGALSSSAGLGTFRLFAALPFSGDNTRSTSDGSTTRRAVWAVSYTQGFNALVAGFEIGAFVGNQLGMTTGTSITPSLGGKVGFGLTAKVKF
jgi:hypothetical protein